MAARQENAHDAAQAAGMLLFQQQAVIEYDKAGAEKFKLQVDGQIKALEEVMATLTGKDNKKERAAKSKEVTELKCNKEYLDACKIIKGLDPVNGHFVLSKTEAKVAPAAVAAPKEEAPTEEKKDAKKEKPAKKPESTGISKAERDELEKIKTDLIARKAELKAAGMSGGQQNKDPQVVEWVARMNELKEKENPGSTQKVETKKTKAALSGKGAEQAASVRSEIEAYKTKLQTEFGYSKKEIKADPELQELEKKLATLEKGGAN